ncbi:MAG: alpha/beta hydrolase family protein [Gemmatimonadota bacterium]
MLHRLAILAITLLPTAALAQDGAIVERDTVRFSEPQPQWLVEGHLQRSDLPANLDSVVVQRITYLSDGLRVKGYLVEPVKGHDLPAVIYNRGGAGPAFTLDDTTAALYLAPLAQHGYVVVASQYRGAVGGEGHDEMGGADVHDVLNLIPLLEAHPRADAERIGMYGWSRGGMMTFLALTETDRVRAAVIGGQSGDPAHDLPRRPDWDRFRGLLARLIPDFEADPDAALRARSAIHWAERLHKGTPILYLHGTADWRSEASSAIRMAGRLYEVGQPFRFVLFEGGDHGISEHFREVDRQIVSWLDRYVRDEEPLPDLKLHGD